MKKLSFNFNDNDDECVSFGAGYSTSCPDKTGGKPLMQALSERKTTREFRQDKDPPLHLVESSLGCKRF